jgi:hypothetical protein
VTTITKPLVDRLLGDVTLTALAPGGVWLDTAPPPNEAPRPVIIVALQRAPLDGETVDCETVVRRFAYLIAVEGTQTQAVAVRNAAARVEVLMHREKWTASGWTVTRSAFVDTVERAYVDGDARLLAVIGQLEVVAQQG